MFYNKRKITALKNVLRIVSLGHFFYIKLLTTAAALVADFDPDLVRLKDW
jgi:hypothetical protein